MCGIAGIFGAALAGDELGAALARMLAAMRHRGPDHETVVLLPELDGGVAVNRLALVDLAGGDPPLANEDGSVLALLNGEIYNHVELRRGLEARGHRFRSRCDTEVLAHLYEDDGDDLLARLNGMFGLAVADLRRRRLLLARDGPGMKPLYWTRTARGIAFASEAKALFAAGVARPAPDPGAIDTYLAVGFVPAPRTGFAGVEKLVAGERLTLDERGVRRDRHWRFAYRREAPRDDREWVDELERRLTAAVDSHLAADVPIGALLSGGWDSSLVAAIAARRTSGRLATFSIVFPDHPDVDESRFSRRMAAWLGSDHREVEYRSSMLPDLLPAIVRQLDEPLSASPVALTWIVAALAAARVKGVLGGEGADEVFGGYAWFLSPRPYWLRRVLPAPLARGAASRAGDARVRRWLRIAAAPHLRAADAEWRRLFTPEEKRRLLLPELCADGPDLEPAWIDDELAASCADDVQRRLAGDLRGRLADGILLKYDKVTMASSLEARLPFLDRGVLDLAAALPSRLKVHRGREKVIVGELARRLLPPEIAARRKQGLSYPKRSWSRPPLGDRLRLLLLDADGPFRREELEPMLAREAGRHEEERRFMALVMLQLWWNEHFGDRYHRSP